MGCPLNSSMSSIEGVFSSYTGYGMQKEELWLAIYRFSNSFSVGNICKTIWLVYMLKKELIDCYDSAKLSLYIPKRKVGTQPLIRSLRSGSPGAERGFQS
jgi:hypothetical protein